MLEFLYLANEENDLIEALRIMENLNNLRPASVQELLEQCRSVRVKRLFLYLAEAGHGWFRHLQPEKNRSRKRKEKSGRKRRICRQVWNNCSEETRIR